MKKYKIINVVNDKWAVWYYQFPKRKGNRIGCYKIVDLQSGIRESRFAFRYKPREGQSQEQSDNLIVMNCIRSFYRPKMIEGIKVERRGSFGPRMA